MAKRGHPSPSPISVKLTEWFWWPPLNGRAAGKSFRILRITLDPGYDCDCQCKRMFLTFETYAKGGYKRCLCRYVDCRWTDCRLFLKVQIGGMLAVTISFHYSLRNNLLAKFLIPLTPCQFFWFQDSLQLSPNPNWDGKKLWTVSEAPHASRENKVGLWEDVLCQNRCFFYIQ